ncbi:hypothetical protein AZE99_06085 [Sphingorhabdus sp. M41]|nr:hypothetical protein AZE99_06085 [Sphingorhabdus sp. M41]
MKAGDDDSQYDGAQVFFIQYGESPGSYHKIMEQTDITRPRRDDRKASPCEKTALAAGLFGYSIGEGQMQSFKPTEGYLRDMEQMPNFTPPRVSSFVAQYLASQIGTTRSSS